MSKGLDSPKSCAVIATQLKAEGYDWVARYLFQHSGFKDLLTKAEVVALSKAGLSVVSVWENGYPTTAGYFTAAQGTTDAENALNRATEAGQPAGTPIYFAVDGDISPSYVTGYFKAVNEEFTRSGKRYTVGAYGSGSVMARLKSLGLIDHEWLAQSRGWSGYEAGKAGADIVQLGEQQVHGRDVDGDISNGHAGGWRAL